MGSESGHRRVDISATNEGSATPTHLLGNAYYGANHYEVDVDCGKSLVQIEGVGDAESARFYLGKKLAFVYRAHKEIRGSKIRVMWGKITRTHGNSGVVRAKFRNNLPPKSFGASLRIMLYPSSI